MAMKFFDDHLVGGLILGIAVGLHFGASLSTFTPLIMVLAILVVLRYITAR